MVKILADIATDFENDYPVGDTFRVILIADSRSAYAFTVNASSDVLTTSSNHDYNAGTTRVQFSSTGSLPASTPQIVPATDYIVDTVPGANTLTVKTVDGTAINFTGAGTGTHTITDVAPGAKTNSTAEWVRKEVPDYDGLAGRPTWTPIAASIDETTGVVTIQNSTSIDNSAGTGGISFNMGLLIKGGSASRGDITGEVSDYHDFEVTQLIAAGSTASIFIPLKRRNAA